VLRLRLATLAIAVLACTPASALLIDFESIPGETPAEGLVVSNQFQAAYGVGFALEDGSDPQLAQTGLDLSAFGGPPDNAPNTPAAGQGVGTFFLTDDGVIGAAPSALVITFDAPVARASVRVLDIDGWEAGAIWEGFVVEARDGLGAVLETRALRYLDPGTGDGVASLFAFDRGLPEIGSLRISFDPSSTKTTGIGFAVDDLFFAVPEPGTGALLAAGIAAFGARRRRARPERDAAPG
jgi:hypothetical protein